jgi:hypothetical protein
MTKQELVQAVRAHAIANYNKGGWDFLVECWEDSDIEAEIGNAKTVRGAIMACKRTMSLLDGRRREEMNMSHW